MSADSKLRLHQYDCKAAFEAAASLQLACDTLLTRATEGMTLCSIFSVFVYVLLSLFCLGSCALASLLALANGCNPLHRCLGYSIALLPPSCPHVSPFL